MPKSFEHTILPKPDTIPDIMAMDLPFKHTQTLTNTDNHKWTQTNTKKHKQTQTRTTKTKQT